MFFVTMGDPAGIGPEIIIKALTQNMQLKPCHIIVIGSYDVLYYTAQQCNIRCNLQKITDISIPIWKKGDIMVYDMPNVDISKYKAGEIKKCYGQAAYEYIAKAVELALQNHNSSIITAPIHKVSLHEAGISEAGHTEILQNLCNTKSSLTMFVVDKLRVLFYTRHLSLLHAIEALNIEDIVKFSKTAYLSLQQIGLNHPKVALAALNPHASDNGLFGTEEQKILQPAIQQLQNENFDIVGPIPADSVFHQGLQGKYDAILSLYHDQGHIACKTYNFERTISVTLGLPFLRMSVDHGTAMDIAGKNIASAISMQEAFKIASDMV